MTKDTKEIIDDSIIQLQELADLFKEPEEQYDFAGYVFSAFFECKNGDFTGLEEKKQYLQEEIPNFKPGKKTWKVFTEALEGLENLIEISKNPVKKPLLKRPLEDAIEESRAKVKKIEAVIKSKDNPESSPKKSQGSSLQDPEDKSYGLSGQ